MYPHGRHTSFRGTTPESRLSTLPCCGSFDNSGLSRNMEAPSLCMHCSPHPCWSGGLDGVLDASINASRPTELWPPMRTPTFSRGWPDAADLRMRRLRLRSYYLSPPKKILSIFRAPPKDLVADVNCSIYRTIVRQGGTCPASELGVGSCSIVKVNVSTVYRTTNQTHQSVQANGGLSSFAIDEHSKRLLTDAAPACAGTKATAQMRNDTRPALMQAAQNSRSHN